MNISVLLILFCVIEGEEHYQKVTTGPIIGRVTDNSARILAEFQSDGLVTMKLSEKVNDSLEIKFSNTIRVMSNNPVIFKFENLNAGTKYFVTFNDNLRTGFQSSFRTLKKFIIIDNTFNSTDFHNLNIAVVSCNDVRYSKKLPIEKNLWTDLADRTVKEEIDYVFHIGDQVYLDHNEWFKSKEGAHSRAKEKYENNYLNNVEEIREIIRNEYRMTFNYPPTAKVLSNAPNIMILDDHEVHNDYSKDKIFLNENSFENFWMIQARYVYYQYQRQLREDVNFEDLSLTGREYFYENIYDIGFYFSETRANKIWHTEKDDMYIGETQKIFIKDSLKVDGKFNKSKAVFFINTTPLMLVSPDLNKFLAQAVSRDFEDLITFNHAEELENLLDDLRIWKESNEKREVYFIGGDIHFGYHSNIYYKKTLLFKQFVSSGINMNKLNQTDVMKVGVILDMFHTLNQDYCFTHHGYNALYNYGIVKIEANQYAPVKIESYLVTSDGFNINEEKSFFNNNLYNNDENNDKDITCCGKDCNINNVQLLMSKLQRYSK